MALTAKKLKNYAFTKKKVSKDQILVDFTSLFELKEISFEEVLSQNDLGQNPKLFFFT